MNIVALNTLQPGERGTVHAVANSVSDVRQRLLEMGLVKGTPIELVRFAPMGDPIEIRIRGYRLSLRRIEAEAVTVVKGSA